MASVGRWLKHQLVKVLVYRRRPLDVAFRRALQFKDDRIEITDEFQGADGPRLRYLRLGEEFTTIHMGSSRYFIANALEIPRAAQAGAELDIDPRRIASGVRIHRVISMAEGSA